MGPDEVLGKDIGLEKIMKPAVSVSPDAPAREALKIMRENNVPGVPVVGEDGKLEGFVTDGHLMTSALPRYCSSWTTSRSYPRELITGCTT